jgi:endonuclease/exonuclease/phosphatase family metal-dependent hydrolase
MRSEWKLARGRLAMFEVEHPLRTLRILMVDLLSSPISPRTPSIRQAAKLIEDRARAGEPIDLVLGDFNTPARLLGFDALQAAAGGFRRASLWSGQWQGTWPSFVPFSPLDIDHVWVNTRLSIRNAAFFTSFDSDHRGQRVDLSMR